MSENIMRVKAKKDRYDVTYMAGDDSGFDMMEGALLVLESLDPAHQLAPRRPRLVHVGKVE